MEGERGEKEQKGEKGGIYGGEEVVGDALR